MKPEKVFKRYDIRGRYPEEIDQGFAELLGKAIASFSLKNYSKGIVVGRDSKESSSSLKKSLIRGICDTGIDVRDVGVGPTDYVALMGSRNQMVSVQVTSSHLPLNTNGFKIMYPEGNGFVNSDLDEVKKIFRQRDFETCHGNSVVEKSVNREDYFDELRNYFLRFHSSIDKTVVVDTLGGASTSYLPKMMRNLGAEVIDIASEKNGQGPYIDPPEPKPENLEYLEERVKKEDAEIAVVNDMDADRLAVYFRDRWLTGSEVFALLASKMKPDNVVASLDTSKTVEQVVSKNAGEIHYTRVGDPFVMDRALEENAELAGEDNGHYAFTGFVPYSSGVLAALMIAGIDDIEQKLNRIPEYYGYREDVSVQEKEEKMEKVIEQVGQKHEVISELDGIKFSYKNATVLLRTSGSSSKIRIITESTSQQKAKKALEYSSKLIRNA